MTNLTIKQRKFVEGIASGLSKRSAAIQAGYSEKSAHAIAHETLNNPEVLKSLEEIMEVNGLSDSYIASKLKELSEAETNGNPHWPARARAIDMMLKVKGYHEKDTQNITNKLTTEQAEAKIRALLQICTNNKL